MKGAVLAGYEYSRPAPCHLVTVRLGDSAGMKGRYIPAEGCNHVLSPVCLNHLPLPSGCTHFSTAGVMNGCPWSCQPHKLSTVCQRGVMSQPFAIRRENGSLMALRKFDVPENQPDGDSGVLTAKQGRGLAP